ncbi:MAG: TetR/AcrR family transcriptional regulator [Janthinobacterium lividum]
MSAPKLNGYQVRTEKTKAQLLAAAEEVFARDGFEGAQMDSIAKAAGRSKGAIYAHYKSKDDLFLALFEHRTRFEMQKVVEEILKCKSREQALQSLKKSLVEITANRTWILLTIEAKLYALRHPEMRERWLEANRIFRSGDGTQAADQQRSAKLIYGEISAAQKSELEARTVAFGPIITGLVLEAEFEPTLLTKKRLCTILNQIADALLQVSDESGA